MSDEKEAEVPAGSDTPTEQNQGVTSEKQETTDTSTPPEGETSEPGSDKPAEPPKEKPKGGFQRRIDELTRRVRDTEREKERILSLLENRESKPTEQTPDGKPVLANFESYDQYLDALSDWKVNSRLSEMEKKRAEENQRQTYQKAFSDFESKAEKLREKYEDYDDVALNPDLQVNAYMSEAIMDSDMGAEILYWLGNNTAEANRISRLSPVAAVREIGRIEARLTTSTPKPKIPAAPEPISPVNAGKTVNSSEPSDSDDIQTWMKKERKRMDKKRA